MRFTSLFEKIPLDVSDVFSEYSNIETFAAYRIGKMVVVDRVALTSKTYKRSTPAATLKSNLLPEGTMRICSITSGDTAPGIIFFNNLTGEMYFSIEKSGQTILCQFVLYEKIPNPVLLWKNPDPTQRFPADGTIELSSGDYEWLEIYYYSNTTSNGVLYQKVKKGDMPVLIHAHFTSSGSGFGYRALQYIDDTHLKGTGYSIRQYFSNNVTPQFDNKATAYGPVKIYGIK